MCRRGGLNIRGKLAQTQLLAAQDAVARRPADAGLGEYLAHGLLVTQAQADDERAGAFAQAVNALGHVFRARAAVVVAHVALQVQAGVNGQVWRVLHQAGEEVVNDISHVQVTIS